MDWSDTNCSLSENFEVVLVFLLKKTNNTNIHQYFTEYFILAFQKACLGLVSDDTLKRLCLYVSPLPSDFVYAHPHPPHQHPSHPQLPLDLQLHGTHAHRAIYSALREREKKKRTPLTSSSADTLDKDYIDLAVPNMKALKMM